MNTGFSAMVNGVNTDLINVFQPFVTNKLTYDTGFLSGPNYNNADLTNIFEAYNPGDPSANNTKYFLSNGFDLSQVFSKKPFPNFPTASSSNPIASSGGYAIGSCMQDNYVIVAYSSGRIFYSNDYGISFSLAAGAPSGTWFNPAMSGQNAIACGNGLLYLSSNYGQSWTQVTGLTGNFAWCAIYDNLALLVDTGNGKVYGSTNYGATWVQCTSASAFAKSWRGASITKHPSNGNYLAVITAIATNALYYCTNFTGTASDTFVQTVTAIANPYPVSLDGLNGLMSTWFSGSLNTVFYYTRDGGQTWTNSGLTVSSNQGGANSLSGQVGVACFNNINDCWVTKDAGVSWTKYQPFVSSLGFTACAANKGNLVVISQNGYLAYYGKAP